MISDISTVIRKLTEQEIDILQSEMINNDGLWIKHPMNKTALDDGKSIIINWVTRINGNYQLQWTFREKFPGTWKVLESIANGKEFGKVYWHVLPPKIHAKPHTDYKNPYIFDNNVDKRYNIFLDMPDGIELVFDGLKTPIEDTKSLEYTLYDMAANKVHAIYNNTDTHFYAMVIDILNPGVNVYKDLYSLNELDSPGANRIS